MGFLSLFMVASMPIVQVLLIGIMGAYLATGYSNILTASARKDMNKVVFAVFTPSLMFTSLAKTVTLTDIISWWFMPVNIGITFLAGSLLGWLACKILKPLQHLQGLIIAFCSAGNLGNLLLIIVPAVCNEEGNPFGSDSSICRSRGLSYSSFSMALGGFFIWTYTYSLMQKAGKMYRKIQSRHNRFTEKDSVRNPDQIKVDAEGASLDIDEALLSPSPSPRPEVKGGNQQLLLPLLSSGRIDRTFWGNLKEAIHQFVEELLAPPTISAIFGFIVGAIPWLKSLIIGDDAPLEIIQETLQLLGNATIPCITLILGGNLTQGLHKSSIKISEIIAVICIRYVLLPLIGIAVVRAAYEVGFLPDDPLYRYVLMLQFALPPAMNIGTMAQLFHVGEDECSVIFLWTYLIAAVALTAWSTVFMWILS